MTTAAAADVREDLLAAARVARPFLDGRSRPLGAEQLALELYTHWFTMSGHGLRPAALAEPPTLIARLRHAHAGTLRFEDGWRVVASPEQGTIVAERRGEQVMLAPPDFVNLDRPAAPARIGDTVAVTARRDEIDLENGWWMTDGRNGPAPPTPMVRLYWNCPPRSAPELVAGLTAVLEGEGVPYTMKCPVDAALFGRVDAVVVYVTPAVYESTKPELRELHARLADSLDGPTPPLTLRLARGVAAAEDPGDGQSYGQSRCAAVADALTTAHRRSTAADDQLVAAMLDGLAVHGISRTHPFLASSTPTDLVTPW